MNDPQRNDLERLRQLGRRMDAEAASNVDVASRIVGQIARRRTRIVDPWLSLVSAGVCATAALVLLVAWAARADHDLFAPLSKAATGTGGRAALLRVLEP